MTDIIEKECHNCGKKIYAQEKFVRKQMFCTLFCLNIFDNRKYNNKEIEYNNRCEIWKK